jgi:hypothetical protein
MQTILIWCIANLVALPFSAFINARYTAPLAVFPTTLICMLAIVVLRIIIQSIVKRTVSVLSILPYAFTLAIPLGTLVICLRTSLFRPELFRFDASLIVGLIAANILTWLTRSQTDRLEKRLELNADGLFLFTAFSAAYFMIGALLNRPDVNTNNIYFAADTYSWMRRMTTPDGLELWMRSVHPLAFLLLRPPAHIFGLLLNGDTFLGGLVLIALAGAGSVFLCWKIMRAWNDDHFFSLLLAILYGSSATSLLFGGLFETYIFSAFTLLLFVRLLQVQSRPLALISAGVLTFGFTLSNIIQNALLLLSVQRNYKKVVVFLLGVLALATLLTIVNGFLYPNSEPFFSVSNLALEKRFIQDNAGPSTSGLAERSILAASNMLVFNAVAPQPYLSLRREGLPRFNFFQWSIKDYAWFGFPALFAWLALFGLALISIVQRKVQNPSFVLGLLLCLIYNLALHSAYGSKPFLYSAHWTYALYLIMGLGWQPLAGKRWFQVSLFIMGGLQIMNNLWFIYLIVKVLEKYI